MICVYKSENAINHRRGRFPVPSRLCVQGSRFASVCGRRSRNSGYSQNLEFLNFTKFSIRHYAEFKPDKQWMICVHKSENAINHRRGMRPVQSRLCVQGSRFASVCGHPSRSSGHSQNLEFLTLQNFPFVITRIQTAKTRYNTRRPEMFLNEKRPLTKNRQFICSLAHI